jgi:hypothetical protein
VPEEGRTVIEPTNRYQALGIPYPCPETMCTGPCEGTGVYPVKHGELTAEERVAWGAAEQANPTDDGWHFIRCPDCGGSGKRP